jgi:hypothetical protein
MHPPPVLTRESGMTAAVVVVLAICFVIKDENATREIPTAFARFGKISIAGWLHLVYFSLNLYVIIMYYFTRNNASNFELCTVGLSLCIYSLLSIMKFPLSTWKIDTFSKVLVVAEILLVGIATYVKAFR